MSSSIPFPGGRPADLPGTRRLVSIDALRGLVMLFMLLDHVRETFFLHQQVIDPMAVDSTAPALFFSRLLAHVCAPVFIFLTGVAACLYGARWPDGRAATAAFLAKRGLFLVALELTLVNFGWTLQFPPQVIYLQVIWAIGLSMLALAALLWLPRPLLIALGFALVAGHNLLDGLHFPPGHALHAPWAVLHDRGWIPLGGAAGEGAVLRVRTSYPLLPWIGVIALGYAAGAWFAPAVATAARQRRLLGWGVALLAGFVLLRAWNGYGDQPWAVADSALLTAMGFLNVTKYPPSLLFLALTLGVGLLLLGGLERPPSSSRWLTVLADYGAAPMFFYLLHIYVLRALYVAAFAVWGNNQGPYFGFDGMGAVWLTAVALAAALYVPTRAFGRFKAQRKDIAWLKYL